MADFAIDLYKNLYSDNIPHALRGEKEPRTTVVHFKLLIFLK
jgi:hypothetical protein